MAASFAAANSSNETNTSTAANAVAPSGLQSSSKLLPTGGGTSPPLLRRVPELQQAGEGGPALPQRTPPLRTQQSGSSGQQRGAMGFDSSSSRISRRSDVQQAPPLPLVVEVLLKGLNERQVSKPGSI